MASQIGGFVHLFAASATGEHEPQVFRMRHDQSLRKLLRAYMSFRQFPKESMAGIEAGLRLAAPERGMGFLDPAATAGSCGLTDGDRVVVHGAPQTPVPQPPAAAAAAAAARPAAAPVAQPAAAAAAALEQEPPRQHAMPPPAAAMPPPPAPPTRRAAPEAQQQERAAAQEPLPSFLATQAEPSAQRGRRRTAETRTQGRGRGRGRQAREEPAGEVEFDEGPAGADGDVAMGAGEAAANNGDGWVELTPREAPQEGSTRRRGRGGGASQAPAAAGRGRGRSRRNGSSQGWLVAEARGRVRKSRAQEAAKNKDSKVAVARPRRSRLGEPNVPKRDMKSVTVSSGPAKGWQVIAWLKDNKKDVKKQNRTVHWRMRSPRRSRAYYTFHSGSGKANLRDDVSEAVYDQIYRTVRPELMKQIKDRKAVLEGVRFSAPKRTPVAVAVAAAVPAAPKKQKRDPVTPVKVRPAEPAALLATQCFITPAKERASVVSWACECDAHLRRHSRCVAGGRGKPALVHLHDRTSIGRCETNDLVLESRLTPQMISRCHAELIREKASGPFRIYDRKSTNGILVNGKAVSEGQDLKSGDIVTFGVQTMHPEFDYIFETRPRTEGCGAIEEGGKEDSDDEAWKHVQPDPQAVEAEAAPGQGAAGAADMDVEAEPRVAVAEAVPAEEAAAAKGAGKMDVDAKGADEEAADDEDAVKGGVILPEGKAGTQQGEEDYDGEEYEEEEEKKGEKGEKGAQEMDKAGADCKMEPEVEVKEEQQEEAEAEAAAEEGEEGEAKEPAEQPPAAEAAEEAKAEAAAEAGAEADAGEPKAGAVEEAAGERREEAEAAEAAAAAAEGEAPASREQ
uniref:FHA domain-containing protein n=1 Tax=Alexandrium monilatum TaxID=311494 RepID=A0A7S4R8D2_9DINO